ncbi:chemotaxis protein CheY [Natronobacterium gregoryi]|uniref:Response regulator n=2 Tax=Natronobacterium gregoryi TaxID=44930 RepID=L0AH76_NATGS|nr:chemotaxis protein CheY [Natronobacterium gregoryi]AFZ73136.1 response regulator containing a CheY-like receiver domain and an HTH DNA-binding domain [Natronobacterium gregoryi SP2]ELY70769.1 response regulator receiver protein [Natronobacterium gregoryi SP2]PLK21547.1 response regulator [Natronobacterium gregoryi SP2]SFI60444.1 two-component system, chemotaxis family, response regulator CheY [Natronobacterium gregoryi]
MDVLITDDSGFMRDLLREILEEDHNVVGEAENGVEAVELYQQEDPDVVFMDIVMPIKDGIEATDEITDLDSDATVVMCTSVEQAEQMKDSIEAGADGYITKPFQKESVLEELNSITSG